MTDTTYKGLLKQALDMIPMLSDTDRPHYQLRATDSAAAVAAKVYDAFLYGMTDAQFQTLQASAERSPARSAAFNRLMTWTDAAADALDAILSPSDMGPFADRFAEFPEVDEADDSEQPLTVSWALLTLTGEDELPPALAERLPEVEPFLFPDTTEVLAELFPEEAPARRGRRGRGRSEAPPTAAEAESPDAVLETIIADSELSVKEAAALTEGYDLGEGVDVPLVAEAAGVAEKAAAEKAAAEKAEKEAAKQAAAEKAAAEKAEKEAAKQAAAGKAAAEKAEKAAAKQAAAEKAAKQKATEPAAGQQAAGAPAKGRRGRTLKRTGGGGSGIMADMRRLIVAHPEIPFTDVERVMTKRGVECKKSTWSPKLSDMRNMLNYLIDLGVVDTDRLAALGSLEAIAKADKDLREEQAASMDSILAELNAKV